MNSKRRIVTKQLAIQTKYPWWLSLLIPRFGAQAIADRVQAACAQLESLGFTTRLYTFDTLAIVQGSKEVNEDGADISEEEEENAAPGFRVVNFTDLLREIGVTRDEGGPTASPETLQAYRLIENAIPHNAEPENYAAEIKKVVPKLAFSAEKLRVIATELDALAKKHAETCKPDCDKAKLMKEVSSAIGARAREILQ